MLTYNNKKGRDNEVLRLFKEPAWNNPVFRFLNHERKDIIPRKDRVWGLKGLVKRMVTALKTAKRPIPVYLQGLHDELTLPRKKVTFAMHCYWDGEAKLGSIDGVLATRAGWYARREVVELEYDPETVTLQALIKEAKKFKCASNVYVQNSADLKVAQKEVGKLAELIAGLVKDAKASDQKFALGRSPHRYLPLTPWQATKVNAALRLQKDAKKWLSPRQQKTLIQIQERLEKDSKALSKLKRPKALKDLTDYQRALNAALTKGAKGSKQKFH